MNQQKDIIGLMKGNILLTKKSLNQLSELLVEYPYFQAAHLLHTLNLLNLKDSYFLFDLRKTSIYMQERKQLLFKIEKGFFKPGLVEALEMEKQSFSSKDSFDIVETFLSEVSEKPELEVPSVSPVSLVSPVSPVYTLTEELDSKKAPPFKFQEKIDKFLDEDEFSIIKIRNDKNEETEEIEIPESLTEQASSESLFTETLAKIYIKKKDYNKALEILQKINLQYPEKSRYFADQIRFLEK